MEDNVRMLAITQRLLAKTQKGELTWEETADPDKFQTSMEDYALSVKTSFPWYYVYLANQRGRTVATLTAKKEDVVEYQIVSNLYSMAKRQALKVDQALEDVLKKLTP